MAQEFTRTTVPAILPPVQHTLQMMRDPLRFLNSLPAHGDLVNIWLGPIRAVVVCHPELHRQVMLRDNVFDKGGFLYDQGREVLGDGLIACRHVKHLRDRRLAQPAFHHSRMPDYARIMLDQITAYADTWQPGAVLDPVREMTAVTAQITAATMFGDRITAAELDALNAGFAELARGWYLRILQPGPIRRLPILGNRRYNRTRDQLRSTLTRMITAAKHDGTDHGDLLSMLVAAADDDGTGWTDDELLEQVVNFFIAGVETTANLLAWTWQLLSEYPDIQNRLHTEVDAADRPLQADSLPWTRQIITETLRLYPPAWLLTRQTTTDTELGGHHLPAGTTMIVSAYLLHHRPDLFPNPEQFRPQRWADTDPARDAYVPFSAGARKCIGDSVAMTESILVLATIAARWQLEPATGRPIKPARSAALSPHAARIRITARD
ncbi:cytochrome P450 [Nocardia sp. NPDC051570]|uniref:cytochrome P450 n=1 Tax=Nocardia sp. NPDC051570 TaxID=3364324 RepID=UPI0037A7EFB9